MFGDCVVNGDEGTGSYLDWEDNDAEDKNYHPDEDTSDPMSISKDQRKGARQLRQVLAGSQVLELGKQLRALPSG